MRVIKLDAIGSTNDFLKDMLRQSDVAPFTVVSAFEQTSGRGQMGAQWKTHPGKNLTFSMFSDAFSGVGHIFHQNAAVALSIAEALDSLRIPAISVKWPNDIMAGRKKIGGILIENLLRPDATTWSVIGIGLNVNQTDFEGLPQAASLATHTGAEFDLDQLLEIICERIIFRIKNLSSDEIWSEYKSRLFSKNSPSVYEDLSGNRFNALISDVADDGRLILEKEDGSLSTYGLKEIKMLY